MAPKPAPARAYDDQKISKAVAKPVVVDKSRSKYLKSLGMVPRGQEHALEFIKSPFDHVKNVTGAEIT